jgi:hypothetical protein
MRLLGYKNPVRTSQETQYVSAKKFSFDVVTAVTMKNTAFWDVTPYGPCKNRRFGRPCDLHHQGDKNGELRTTLAVTSNRNTLPHGVTFQKTAFFIVTAVRPEILHRINWLGSVTET